MDIRNYEYVKATELTGDILSDVREFLLQNDKRRTLEHVTAVAETNKKIAEKFGLDKNICIISGYLHDISTVVNPKDMLNYMKDNNLFIDEAEIKYHFLLHQRVSKLLAKEFFCIEDERVLSAIECHTTLKSNPSQYDMALFIADKLSWDQEGTPPFYDAVSLNLSISLESACLSYINYIIDNNIILHPHSWLLEAREYLESNI